MYIATVGTVIVEQAPTLAELRRTLADIFDPGQGEDVVVWEDGRRVVLILTADGRTVEMDAGSLTWRWPPHDQDDDDRFELAEPTEDEFLAVLTLDQPGPPAA